MNPINIHVQNTADRSGYVAIVTYGDGSHHDDENYTGTSPDEALGHALRDLWLALMLNDRHDRPLTLKLNLTMDTE